MSYGQKYVFFPFFIDIEALRAIGVSLLKKILHARSILLSNESAALVSGAGSPVLIIDVHFGIDGIRNLCQPAIVVDIVNVISNGIEICRLCGEHIASHIEIAKG
jgi:hypothetical protein